MKKVILCLVLRVTMCLIGTAFFIVLTTKGFKAVAETSPLPTSTDASVGGNKAAVPKALSAKARPPMITTRHENHRVWEQVKFVTNSTGPQIRVEARTNSYTELCPGVCYQRPDGSWSDSKAEFVLAADGSAEATELRHKVRLKPNLHSIAAVEVTLPDGQIMSSTFRGLYLYDPKAQTRYIVSQITNSIGTILSPDRVVYSNCFDGIKGDLLIKVTKGGLIQDVVIHESLNWIPLDEMGFDGRSTVLEAWTEFYESPAPAAQTNLLTATKDATGTVSSQEIEDQSLTFGSASMRPGLAFTSTSDRPNFRLGGQPESAARVPVAKRWVKGEENRQFLIESVRWGEVRPHFRALENAPRIQTNAAFLPSLKSAGIRSTDVPPRLAGKVSSSRMQFAAIASETTPAFVLDYEVIYGNTYDILEFRPAHTYFISGPVIVEDQLTIGAGAVIKYSGAAGITIAGSVKCETGPGRPAFFTSRYDDSLGAEIEGSGDPEFSYSCALTFNAAAAAVDLHDLCFFYGIDAIVFYNLGPHKVRHSQFRDVGFAFWGEHFSLAIHNVLFDRVYNVTFGAHTTIDAQHVTAHHVDTLISDPGGDTVTATFKNSLLIGIPNPNVPAVTAPWPSVWEVSEPEPSVFATSGYGDHYLPENSEYRGAGNASIDPDLRRALRHKTTQAPLELMGSITENLTLTPRDIRNSGANPDLGYSYDVVDYVARGLYVQGGATLLAKGGVVVGVDSGYDIWGIRQDGSSHVISEGAPTTLNRFVEIRSVQEQEGPPVNYFSTFIKDWSNTTVPDLRLRFTEVLGRGGLDWHVTESGGLSTIELKDCQVLGGGGGGTYSSSLEEGHAFGITNNLFESSTILITGSGATQVEFRNNTFSFGQLTLTGGDFSWTVRDNLFDDVDLSANPPIGNSHNGYYSTTQLAGSGPDVPLPNPVDFRSGLLGRFYLPPGSCPLLNAGSRNPAAAALFHHTTQVLQTKEGSKAPGIKVDIGFHYAALNSDDLEVDTDGDGLSDIREDFFSNNAVDFGETDWNDPCFQKVDVMLVMDVSNSLSDRSFADEKLAAEVFASKLRFIPAALDRVGVIKFCGWFRFPDGQTIYTAPEQKAALGAPYNVVLPAIHGLERCWGTQFHQPIDLAREELVGASTPGTQRVIVLMTDGQVYPGPAYPGSVPPGQDPHLYEDLALWAADDAKKAGIKIYTIGFDSIVDVALLKAVATREEDFFGPDNQSESVDSSRLNEFLDRIVGDLCRGNGRPFVNAGADQTIWLPDVAQLSGVAYDTDNNPPGFNLAIGWSKLSGPGPVSFAPDPSDPNNRRKAIASFTVRGNYSLRLSASDTLSAAFDILTVHVMQDNQLPVVDAGPSQTIELPNRVYLPGRVTDDGQPSGTMTVGWSKVSGPGTVTFDDVTSSETMASFSVSGLYVLRLRGNDGTPDIFCDAGQTLPGVCDDVVIHVKDRPEVELFKDVDYVSAGVGMRRAPGTLFHEAGQGTITLSGISGSVRKAYLYWNGPIDVDNPNANAEVVLNGRFVVGQNIGIAHNNCWGYNVTPPHSHSYGSSHSYRADVTPIVLTTGNGSYTLQSFYKSEEINVNGASLVVVFENQDDQQNGDLLLYQGNDSNFYKYFGANGPVYAIAGQPDGKILIGGDFSSVGGIPRNRVARLWPDGEVDQQFRPFPGVNGAVRTIAVQANGKVLIGGEFTEVNGEPRNHIARLESNGTLAEGFDHDVNDAINCMIQEVSSGKIYAGGIFTQIGQDSRNRLARFMPDGTLDSFDPELEHDVVNALALDSEGSVLVGGSYLDNEQIRGKLSRVAPNGLVLSFDPDINDAVYAVQVQENDRVLMGGAFTEVEGDLRPRIARLLASGELDVGFNPPAPNDTVFAIQRYYDSGGAEAEAIFIAGAFTHLGGTERRGLAHITEAGSFGGSPQNLNGHVHALLFKDLLTSSSVYAGGAFHESAGMGNICLYAPSLIAPVLNMDEDFRPSDWHWGQVFPPFVYSGSSPAPTLELHVSDGQPGQEYLDDAIYFGGQLLLPVGDNFHGALGAMWDIIPFSVGPPFITPGLNQPILRTGPWEHDCFSLVAAILKLPKQSISPFSTPAVPRPAWTGPIARADAVTVPRELGATMIHVLENDTSAEGFPVRITDVSSPAAEAGIAQIVYGGTAILFTPNYSSDPPPSSVAFSYTIVDRNGYNATANVILTFAGTFAHPLNTPVDAVPLEYYVRTVSDTLTDGDPNDKPSLIRAGIQRAHYYRFAAGEGDSVTVSIASDESGGLPTHVYIRDPLGRVIAASSHVYYTGLDSAIPKFIYDHSTHIERIEHSGIYTVEVASHAPNEFASYGVSDWGSYGLTLLYQVPPESSELIVLNNGLKVTPGDLIDFGNERTKTIVVRNVGKSDALKPITLSLPSGSSAFTVTPGRLGAIPAGQAQIVTISVKNITPGDKQGELRFFKELTPYEPDPEWDFTVKLHANTSVPPGSKNSAPLLKHDEFIVYENTETSTLTNSCDVLANDSDPDGDPLKIIKITQGTFGEVKTNSGGTLITYKPEANHFGTDMFEYTVYDGHGAVGTATVLVKVRARTVEILQPPPYNAEGNDPPNANTELYVHIAASTSDGEITRVAFLTNGVVNFQTNKGPYQFNWVPVAQGFYEIKAVAWDDRGEKLESEVRMVGVGLTGDRPGIGRIDNLSEGQVVRDGLFAIHGTADDPDDQETSDLDDLTYTFTLYELTPGLEVGQPWLRSLVSNFGVIYPGPGNPPPPNGKKVIDGPLGTLDFTRVPNGVYDLEFGITQAARNVVQNISFTLDSQAKIGQFTFSVTDLEMTMGNIPFAIVRTYDSFNLKRGDFGVGWTMSMNNLEIKVDEDREWTVEDPFMVELDYLPMRVGGSRNVTLTLPDGRRTTFVFTLEPAAGESFATLVAKWIAPPGVNATLTPLDGDTLQFLPWQSVIEPMWSGANGGPEVPWENYDFRGYILTNSDGMRYDILAESPGEITLPPVNAMLRGVRPYMNPKLTTIRSRTGERIEIEKASSGPDNVVIKHYQANATSTESPTRTVAILRDDLGRVTKVFDPKHVNPNGTLIGNPEPALEYQYSSAAANANLTKVIKLIKAEAGQPVVKNTTTYQYAQPGHPHFITAILDGRRNSLDAEVPTLKAQADEKGRLTGFTNAFDQELVSLEHNLSSQREIIKQPLSSTPGDFVTSVIDYDTRGHVIRKVDPLGNATSRSYDDAGQVLTETDALGKTSRYDYDQYGHRMRIVDPNEGVTTIARNRFGQVETLRDPRVNALYPNEVTVSNTYDPTTGNLLTSRDINGDLQAQNSYNSRHLIQNVIDVMQTITKHDYYLGEPGGRPGDLKRIYTTDPVNTVLSSTTYTWDGVGNRLSETRQRTVAGEEELTTTTYVYDEQNRLIETRDAMENLSTTEYNLAGKPVSTVDRAGRETKYLYDARYNLIQVTHPTQANPESGIIPDPRILVERTVYDARNRPIFKQDRMECSAANWPYGVTVAHGTGYVYDEAGRLSQTERVQNAQVYIDIQPQDQPGLPGAWVTYNANQVVSFTTTIYNGVGQVIQTVDARGFSTFYGYDAAGRRTHITNALGEVTAFVYDENGNQTSMTDALGRTTEYIFDELNRRTGVKLPLLENHTQHLYLLTQYDKLGQRVAETNQDNIITRYLYDRLGRLIAVTNADGGIETDRIETRYGYDEQHLIQQTNAAGHVTTFGYNKLGQRVFRTLPDGATERFFYDVAGNTTIRTNLYYNEDVNGIIDFKYDVHNLLRTKRGRGLGGYPLAEFTYYPNGLRLVVSDTSHQIEPGNADHDGYRTATFYAWDAHNRLSIKDVTNGSGSHRLLYDYDASGNVTRLIAKHVLYYEWDGLNRLTNVLSDANSGWPLKSAAYQYDSAGNLAEYEYPTGIKTTLQHDRWNRLHSVTSRRGATPIASFSYALLNRGNRETLTENVQGRPRTVTYSYDKLDRLIQETIGGVDPEDQTPPPTGSITYDTTEGYADLGGFDKNANRRSRTDTLDPEYFPYPDQSFSYDNRDRLESDMYDDAGNTLGPLQTDVLYQDKYDLEHRLVQRTRDVLIGGIPYRHVIELAYDADGHRVSKANKFYPMSNPNVLQSDISPTVYYIIDELNPTGYAQVIDEAAYRGAGIPVGELTHSYDYGLDLISQKPGDSSDVYFYGYDGHGSVRYLTRAELVWEGGQQVLGFRLTDTYTYDAFGVLLDQRTLNGTQLVPVEPGIEGTPNHYLYAGEYWDEDFKLYYLRARHLNPETGRFPTMDAFEGHDDNPISLHRYLYAHADPVNRIDPSGLFTPEIGKLAEKAIQAVYDLDHPLDIMRHGRWTKLGLPSGGAYRLKPDIFNTTKKRWGEIKPFSFKGIVHAAEQYATYTKEINPFGYKPDAGWTPSTHFAYAGTMQIFFFNAGGIIFYTDMVDQDMENAAPGLITIALAREHFLKNKVRFGQRSLVGGALKNVPKMAAGRIEADRTRLHMHVAMATLLATIGGALVP